MELIRSQGSESSCCCFSHDRFHSAELLPAAVVAAAVMVAAAVAVAVAAAAVA